MSTKNLLEIYNDSQSDPNLKLAPNISVDQDLVKNRQKLNNILKITSNIAAQGLFFQKRNVSSTTQLSAMGTPGPKSRQLPINSPDRGPKSTNQDNRSNKNLLSFDARISLISPNRMPDLKSASGLEMPQLKSSFRGIAPNNPQQSVIIQEDINPYYNTSINNKDSRHNSKNNSILNINTSPNMNNLLGTHNMHQSQLTVLHHHTSMPSIVLSTSPSHYQNQFSSKITSRQAEINQLKQKIAKLERENQELKEYFEHVNEFKHAMQDFQENQRMENIDQRRLLLLKSQVLSLQRTNQVYKETIHSQEKLASECQKVLRWIEAIMQEAATYKPHKLAQRRNIEAFETSEEGQDGLASRLRGSNVFDPDEEEITEQGLRQIFKDFNLKNKIEKLKHTLQETLVTTRRSHAQNVLKNNEFIFEDRTTNNSPTKSLAKQQGPTQLNRRSSLLKRKSMRLTDKQKEDQTLYDKINIRLDQEKFLLAEEKLSLLVKKMMDINGKLYDEQVIPPQEKFMDLCQSLRDGIDTLLVLGISPFTQSTFSLMDFQPDNYYVNVIKNSCDEWIQYVRERVGVQRMSRFDPFLKQDHQIFNNFDVQTLYALINQAQNSNLKKKELTKLILNLRRVENRYETSFQLLVKQNELLQRIMIQLNLHVEKLIQFNKKQHHFYEKILMQDIFNPFLELTRLERKIGGSESENKDNLNKKDLQTFYTKFQSMSQQFENAFKNFTMVEECDVKLNNNILELMKIYEKNHMRFKDNVQDWKKVLSCKTDQEETTLLNIQTQVIKPKVVETEEEMIDNYEFEEINNAQLLLNDDDFIKQ